MAPEPDSFGRRVQRAFTRLLVFVLVVGLLAAVTFLLSQLNARRFWVQSQDGHLLVRKGRPLPLGAAPYRPEDPRLAEAYAPLPLQGATLGALAERTFEDREELDRALFDLLRTLAAPRLRESSEPGEQSQGLYYLHRATLLQGLSPEQRQVLSNLQTEVAFIRGRTLLAKAQETLKDALAQLALATGTENPHTRAAQQMMLQVEGPARALDEGLRRAVHQVAVPSEKTPAPPPTPTPTPAAPGPSEKAEPADAG